MKIDKFVHDDYCVLTLKGEFDTFYVPALQEEVQSLLDQGISHLVLNLRLVKFINSTALGAIIKTHKLCKAAQGELVISQPSSFVHDVISKVGIDQLVSVFDDEDKAIKHLIKSLNELELAGATPVNQEKVLVTFPDETRNKQIGGKKTLVGQIGNVNGERIQFLWNGSKLGLDQGATKALFFEGSDVHLKFQVKMFKKGFFDLGGRVASTEDAADGAVRVTATFEDISESDRDALTQFAADMEFLKKQLPS
ncbi:MAG: STAS domain-containing protein [Planctomycetota bacterium]